MAETTKKLGLIKPAQTDYYSIEDFNKNADAIEQYATENDTALATKENKHRTTTADLLASAWVQSGEEYTQIVAVMGMTPAIDFLAAAAPESDTAYKEAGVKCIAQDYDELTFAATDVPATDLVANILIFGG